MRINARIERLERLAPAEPAWSLLTHQFLDVSPEDAEALLSGLISRERKEAILARYDVPEPHRIDLERLSMLGGSVLLQGRQQHLQELLPGPGQMVLAGATWIYF